MSITANDDQTARNMRELFEEAGLSATDILLWNVVPWYDGKRTTNAVEVQAGCDELENLVQYLPNLKTVVLVGNDAQKAEKYLLQFDLNIFKSSHPSPLVKNLSPDLYEKIVPVWRQAFQELE